MVTCRTQSSSKEQPLSPDTAAQHSPALRSALKIPACSMGRKQRSVRCAHPKMNVKMFDPR